MLALLVIVLLFLAAVVAAELGWAADSRDREFSMGRVIGHRPREENRYPDESSTAPVGADRPSDRAAAG